MSWAPTLGSQRAQARSKGWATSVVTVGPAVGAKAWTRSRRLRRWPTARSTVRTSRVQVDAFGATRTMRRQPAKLPASRERKVGAERRGSPRRRGQYADPWTCLSGGLSREGRPPPVPSGAGTAHGPWRRERRARRAERCPAQDVDRPLKGKSPRMPPGWNKPGRWCRRGAKRAEEPWTCRPYRTRAAGNGDAGEVGASAPVPADRAGWEPHGEAASPQMHRRAAKPQEGMLRASAAPRAGERRGGAQGENGAQVTRTIGRDERRSRAEDPRSQAVAAKAGGGGSTR